MTSHHDHGRGIVLGTLIGLFLWLAVACGLWAATAHAAPWNPAIYAPDGETYEEHIAYGEAFIAQARAIAIAHCGEPYFGTVC